MKLEASQQVAFSRTSEEINHGIEGTAETGGNPKRVVAIFHEGGIILCAVERISGSIRHHKFVQHLGV